MDSSTLTVKFKGIENEILDEMVASGMFATKTEALRSALVKYAIDADMFKGKALWERIKSAPRRKVSDKQLFQDIGAVKNEA
ncbi:MAG: hypothetical protein HY394_04085 [Candidatus Diapherotrites archaeon]|nr:hypothetical protein [Candidatus Diapherotrites archaeon]